MKTRVSILIVTLGTLAIVLGTATILWRNETIPTEDSLNGNAVKIFPIIPFGTQTFSPVTRESIERDATCIFEISGSNQQVSLLRSLLENRIEGDFDDRVVRFKATGLFRNEVFVDIDGGVIRGQEKPYRLSEDAFRDFESIVGELAKSRGCTSLSDY